MRLALIRTGMADSVSCFLRTENCRTAAPKVDLSEGDTAEVSTALVLGLGTAVNGRKHCVDFPASNLD